MPTTVPRWSSYQLSSALAMLAPVAGLAAVVAVGLLAARPVVAVAAVEPAGEYAPEESIEMVQLANDSVAAGEALPYRSMDRCRLVLGARMLTLAGAPPARTSLAYRLVDATAVDGDVLRLAWTNARGEDVVVRLRPAATDADERAAVVGDVVRRATARRQAG